jgi:hypothetical protein
MLFRAEPSGVSLTEDDASLVKGMLVRGDRQHDIAAWFGVNSGRISDIANGGRFASASAAPNDRLPLRGPYLSGRDAQTAIWALEEAQKTIATALELIRERAAK